MFIYPFNHLNDGMYAYMSVCTTDLKSFIFFMPEYVIGIDKVSVFLFYFCFFLNF